jgi:nucleotide-binding universal stress UspA family protein
MFTTVIVGVDGRAGGRDAIALGRLLVGIDGGLTLAHVGSRGDEDPGLLERERTDADLEAELTTVEAPSVGRGLHELAERAGADLLVVGSSHRGFAGRVLVGDDTRASLNGSPCAIAVAPVGYARDLGRITQVGVGYDGSAESKAALGVARTIADHYNATLRALWVVSIPAATWIGSAAGALDELADAARAELGQLDGVETEARIGIAGEELAAFGERVDLLVVGSRGYGPLKRLMLGSTSEHLSAHARSPLLVLPRGAQA